MMNRMVKGERQRPGVPMGTCADSSIRGRYRKIGETQPLAIFRRYFCRYALVGLALFALGVTWLFAVVGCSPVSGSGRMDSTSGDFIPTVRQSPGEVTRLLRNAHYYKLMGRPELALKELEQAHLQNPDNLQIVNTLAQNYEEQGHFETARKLYQEALTRNGPHPALANNLSFTYYLEGRYQEAETCYRQTLARDPNNEAARNNLGLLYCRLGRQDEARRLWQEVEGPAAAENKTRQALTALGMSDRPVYARISEPAPPLTEGSTTTPVAAVSRPPASTLGNHSQAEPPALQKVAMRLPPIPAPEKPIPNDVKPLAEAPAQPLPQKASPAPSPTPAPLANPRQAPLTCAELVGTAIEVRNGTPTPHLAREMRSLLEQEGFSVASIGNHLDFGAEKTIIYYRPEAQRVAQTLQAGILSMAGMEETSNLNQPVAIKILLGHNLLENQGLMTRLGKEEVQPPTAAKAPPLADKPLAANPKAERPVSVNEQPQTVTKEAAPPAIPLPSQSPAPMAQAPSPRPLAPLTAANQEDTAIEVLNGTRTRYLARKTRTLLNLEGFMVPKIGNYINFRAEKTTIFYRPEGERVARALSQTLFPGAELEPSLKLRKDIAVQILLGSDLLERPQLMARLVAEGK
jgi:hypothetical protein